MKKNIARYLQIYATRPTDINEHLYTLYYLTLMIRPKTILEIGCGDGGGSTLALRLASSEVAAHHYTIDIEPAVHANFRVKNEFGLEDGWTFVQGDSTLIGKTWDIAVDILFIDSSHRREDTIEEIRLFEPNVRDGGLMIFHDTGMLDGVRGPILDFLQNHPDYDFFDYEHNSGLGVVRKKKPLPEQIMKIFEPEMKIL